MIGCLLGLLRGGVALVLLLAGGLVLMFVVYAVLVPSDWMTAHYATHRDAVVDGGIERGWIPDFVPERATNISDRHNLDSNHLQVEFSFTGGFDDFTPGLKPVPQTIRPALMAAEGVRPWWRERAIPFLLCRHRTGVPGLLLVAPAEGRAMYREPVKAEASTAFDPCKDKAGNA